VKRGFPRPRHLIEKTTRHPTKGSYGKKWDNKTYPHPYNASDNHPANISTARLAECIKFKKCGTCGEPVDEDLVGLILANPASPIWKRHDKRWYRGWLHSESGPYHLKCLTLNFTMCPHLVETKQYMPAVGLWKDVRAEILDAADRR
jgi:hypothetical protein